MHMLSEVRKNCTERIFFCFEDFLFVSWYILLENSNCHRNVNAAQDMF